MIDLPMQAEVNCSDGIAGLSTYIIANPINQQLTHLVVKSLKPPFSEYLVPINKVEATAPHQIALKCTRHELENMEPFTYEEYLRTTYPAYLTWPYATLSTPIVEEVTSVVTVKHSNVPDGEVTVKRGAKVEATDGYIGLVDELLVNANNMQVTHLVLHERHIFEQREISIPVSQIEHVYEDVIYLKLDRKRVEALPTTPIQRWQLQEADIQHQ